MNKYIYLGIGFAVGYLYGKVKMITADIDEYHAVRMDLDEKIYGLNNE